MQGHKRLSGEETNCGFSSGVPSTIFALAPVSSEISRSQPSFIERIDALAQALLLPLPGETA